MCSKRVIGARDSVTRGSIAKAAAKQFAKHGIVETTMRDIVQEAGISLGTGRQAGARRRRDGNRRRIKLENNRTVPGTVRDK